MNSIIRTTQMLVFCVLCASANAAGKPDQATALIDAAKRAVGGAAWDGKRAWTADRAIGW